jgi:hypothetical protein
MKTDYTFYIYSRQVVACNYNALGFYEFYGLNNDIVAKINSPKIKLPKDNAKAWAKLYDLFSDKE